MSAEVVLPQENTEQEAVQGWMIYTYILFTIKGELLRREGPETSMFHRRILFDRGLFFFLATLGQANLSGLFLNKERLLYSLRFC